MKCVIGGAQLRGTGARGARHTRGFVRDTGKATPPARPWAEHEPRERSGGSASPSSRRDRALCGTLFTWAGSGDSQGLAACPLCIPGAQLHSILREKLLLRCPRQIRRAPLSFLGFHVSRCPLASQAFPLLNVISSPGDEVLSD